MIASACALCGYARSNTDSPCPTCGSGLLAADLALPLAGPGAGVGVALAALPRGFQLLLRTPRVKRWLLPPLILTGAAIVALFLWSRGLIANLAERIRPDEIELPDWEWIEQLPAWLAWLGAAWHGLAAAIEWILGSLIAFLLAQPFQFLTVFLIGSLVVWYGASIIFEALAGPFLDEIQARVEKRWFGEDPRSRMERPKDVPSEDAALRLFALGAVAACALVAGLVCFAQVSWPWALAATPLGLLLPQLIERRFGRWLRWFLKVEARALYAGIQGAILSFGILILALPLYFVPVVGYFLYAMVTGIATATSLLDIPLERRDWPFRARLGLLRRHLPAWITFGIVSGLFLSVPLIGPLLFVPVTSLGGLWLLCRLDKGGLVTSSAPDDLAKRQPWP